MKKFQRNEFKFFIKNVKIKKWNKSEDLFISHDNEIIVANKIFGPNSGLVSYHGDERLLTFIQNLITIYNIIFSKIIIFNNPILDNYILFKKLAISFNKI